MRAEEFGVSCRIGEIDGGREARQASGLKDAAGARAWLSKKKSPTFSKQDAL
jgi:hypothetical protein